MFGTPQRVRLPRRQRPLQKAKAVIRQTAEALKKKAFVEEVGIQTTEVFLGGSIGQGTTVPGHFDVDLVLYTRDLDCIKAAEDGYEDFQEKIKSYLQNNLGQSYTYQGTTEVAIKFNYRLLSEGIDIDVDLLLSPYWDNQEQFFSDLAKVKPPSKQLMFSVSASKYQTDFIKHLRGLDLTHPQAQRVRELIRRAKAWRNKCWEGEEGMGRPKSYLMSMLVITAFDRIKDEKKHSKLKQFAHLVQQEMIKLVREITSTDDLDLTIPGTNPFMRETYAHLLPPRPRIIDPVNPSNNLYLSGVGPDPYSCEGCGKWSELRERIQRIDITITSQRIMKM